MAKAKVKAGIGAGVLVLLGLAAFALTRKKEGARAAEEAWPEEKEIAVLPGEIRVPEGMTYEGAMAVGYTTEELRTGILEVGHEDPLLTWAKEHVTMTDEEIDFWLSGTIAERVVKIPELDYAWPIAGDDIRVSIMRQYARYLRQQREEAEAEALGIPVAGLEHYYAVEKAAAEPYEEYKATTTYPSWYSERDKQMGYASLLTEAIEQGFTSESAWVEAVQSGTLPKSAIMEAYQAGMISDYFLDLGMASAAAEPVPPPAIPYIPPAAPVAAPVNLQYLSPQVQALIKKYIGMRW